MNCQRCRGLKVKYSLANYYFSPIAKKAKNHINDYLKMLKNDCVFCSVVGSVSVSVSVSISICICISCFSISISGFIGQDPF